jgi:DNA-binding MarR family transcriptional regulator
MGSPVGSKSQEGTQSPPESVPVQGNIETYEADLEPTSQELKISARVILHIAQQPRVDPHELAPESLTQAGMAEALGSSQAAISHTLNRLTYGGLLEVRTGHVEGRRQRVKVYQLTQQGNAVASHIRKSMETV